MEKHIRSTIKSINLVYYSVYLLSIIIVLFIFFMTYGDAAIYHIDEKSTTGVTISSIYIIYMLITIPLAFYLFHVKTKKWRTEKDAYIMFNEYKKGAYIRLWVIAISLLVGLILVYLMRSRSMVFCAAIAAIALYLCKPTTGKIVKELDINEEEF